MEHAAEPLALQPEETAPVVAARGETIGRLYVASNRVMQRGETQAGGLAQAMLTLLESCGGTWVGWSGRTADGTTLHTQQIGRIAYRTFDFNATMFDGYYASFANGCLWPLLHGRIDLMRYRASARQRYLQVNEVFAAHLASHLTDDDTLWVHDYHLMPLAAMLRRRGVRCRIGFFLHTPFQAARTMTCLPQHAEIVGVLRDYDLVGLQTPADVAALLDYFRTLPGMPVVDDEGAEFSNGHRCRVAAFPIGVDLDQLAALAQQAMDDEEVVALRESLGERALLIGVDRLDYSKGLPQRLRAFGQVLRSEPRFLRQATFLQVAPETRTEVRDYRRLRSQVQRIVGEINGHNADASWTPVRYVNQGYPHASLAGFYRIARVGVVTPLCDGMNLVAKEYLACQPPHDPGVLVLSQFAGAAHELRDSALLVNPYDVDATARTIVRALDMPRPERRARWSTAMAQLRAGDIHAWRRRFLSALAAVPR